MLRQSWIVEAGEKENAVERSVENIRTDSAEEALPYELVIVEAEKNKSIIGERIAENGSSFPFHTPVPTTSPPGQSPSAVPDSISSGTPGCFDAVVS